MSMNWICAGSCSTASRRCASIRSAATAIFGRSGLLAHTYMLGPNGDSNGCVSFKNYDAFLRAYQQGRVKRLAVVSRL